MNVRALADYLATGELRRNIARVRRRHAARRDLISECFAGVPRVRVRPMPRRSTSTCRSSFATRHLRWCASRPA